MAQRRPTGSSQTIERLVSSRHEIDERPAVLAGPKDHRSARDSLRGVDRKDARLAGQEHGGRTGDAQAEHKGKG